MIRCTFPGINSIRYTVLQIKDPENIGAIVDYHMMRVCLRTGLVQDDVNERCSGVCIRLAQHLVVLLLHVHLDTHGERV